MDMDLDLEEVGLIPIRERDPRSSSGTRNGEERRFLIGADEDEEKEEEEEREGEGEGEMPGVMGVLSGPDMHTSNLNGDTSGRAHHDDVSGGGLSAKAGIILVGFSHFSLNPF